MAKELSRKTIMCMSRSSATPLASLPTAPVHVDLGLAIFFSHGCSRDSIVKETRCTGTPFTSLCVTNPLFSISHARVNDTYSPGLSLERLPILVNLEAARTLRWAQVYMHTAVNSWNHCLLLASTSVSTYPPPVPLVPSAPHKESFLPQGQLHLKAIHTVRVINGCGTLRLGGGISVAF